MLKSIEQAVFVERDRCINCDSQKLTELSSGRYADQPLAGFMAVDPWGEDPAPYLQTATWSLVKCNNCSQVFHRRILDEEWNERRFSQWMSAGAIKEFEARTGSAFRRHFNSATNHVEHVHRIERLTRDIRSPDEPVRLLDFGCGFGHFLEVCRDFGFEVVGVDRSVGRRSEASLKIFPSLGELTSAPKFHAIALFEVLEHLDHPAQALTELSSYLVPGGLLILETPDCAGVSDISTRQDYLKIHPLEHINGFTHETLKSIAERNGFRGIPRGVAHVSAESSRALKTELKYALGKGERTTQMYFRLDS